MGSLAMHVDLLNDVVRTKAFDRALAETIRPGDVVADLGAGSGILSLLALKHGARRVYAVERHPVAVLARAIARENGMADRLIVVRGEAATIRLPEKVDVVVSETLGNAVFDEGILELLDVAKRRLLKRGGRMIPSRIRVMAAPAVTPQSPGRWAYGVRLEAFRSILAHSWWSTLRFSLRGPARKLGEAVPGRDLLPREYRGRWRTPGAGGLLVWFDAQLSPSVRLDARKAPSWKPAFFPARERLRGEVAVRLRFDEARDMTWQFEGQAAQTSSLGTLELLVRSTLREHSVPRLSADQARRAGILADVDGRRTVLDLARRVRGLSREEALRWVQAVCLEGSALW